jgi:hypothetical protein
MVNVWAFHKSDKFVPLRVTLYTNLVHYLAPVRSSI